MKIHRNMIAVWLCSLMLVDFAAAQSPTATATVTPSANTPAQPPQMPAAGTNNIEAIRRAQDNMRKMNAMRQMGTARQLGAARPGAPLPNASVAPAKANVDDATTKKSAAESTASPTPSATPAKDSPKN